MNGKHNKKAALAIIVAMAAFAVPVASSAVEQEDYDALKSEVQTMRAEMVEMRELLKQQGLVLQNKTAPAITKAEVTSLKKEVKEIAKTAKGAAEWKNINSNVNMSGYAAAGYTDKQTEDGRFNQVQFNPIFNYQYKDFLLLESELEFELADDGTTDTKLEYLQFDLLLNDYATFVIGKFLSPIGQFRQNLHPAWINKIPSKPLGFGGNAAAPVADLGVQLRGAMPLEAVDANYAFYVGNGPELTASGGKITAINTDGFARDIDNNKVYGGRLGLLPLPKLEIGVSGAAGNVALLNEADRDYTILGSDFGYQWKNLDLRGEYVRQKIGALAGSSAPEEAAFEAWYAQTAYKFPYNLEGVLRYGNFNSPVVGQDQEQLAIGVNYLFAPQVQAKLAYEFNDGDSVSSDSDRLMGQVTYGF